MSGSTDLNGATSQPQPSSLLDPENARQSHMIDIIDQLRDLNIDRTIPLPQLIVCGAQSAGKSSVLGAITEIPFPSGEQTCTRYITKVRLDHSDKVCIQVSIEPGSDRDAAEQRRLRGFRKEGPTAGEGSRQTLHRFIKEADEAIFQGLEDEKTIKDDVLSIRITGPNKRALQLVDIPGLIGFDRTGGDIVNKIEGMVRKYMKMTQSTILAVVPGNNDIDNNTILTLCNEYDPEGQRSLGIITKPDIASDPDTVVDIVKGNVSPYNKFEWHLIRNLGPNSTAERDEEERHTFAQEPWSQLLPGQLGIENLRSRLRQMYFSAAEKELPELEEKIHRELRMDRFRNLTEEPQPESLVQAFTKATQRLKEDARDKAKGTYTYHSTQFEKTSAALLRSRVQEQDHRFRDEMMANGQSWRSHTGMGPLDPNMDLMPPTPPSDSRPDVSGSAFPDLNSEIQMASSFLKDTRGTDLDNLFSPDRIAYLFWENSKPWHGLAEEHVENVYSWCKKYFVQVTESIFKKTDDNIHIHDGKFPDGFDNAKTVAGNYVQRHIIPELDVAREKAKKELFRLEQDRQDWLKNLDKRFLVDQKNHRQKTRFRSQTSAMRARLEGKNDGTLDPEILEQQQHRQGSQGYQDDRAEEFLNFMQSHYLIARDVFISNVIVQVIERHFMRNIQTLIPDDLDKETVQGLARENSESARKKTELRKEKTRLMKALQTLESFQQV